MSYASLDAKNVNVSTCYTELQSFQKAGGGGSRALLRIDKESDGRIVLRSVLDSELTLFDRISRFFFPKRYLLENVRTIVDKVLSNQDFKAKLARDLHDGRKEFIDAITNLNKHIQSKNGQFFFKLFKNKISSLRVPQEIPNPASTPLLPTDAPIAPPALATVSVAPCSIRGAGLNNFGNTCFFNSTIKALWATRTFLPMLKERNERLKAFSELVRCGSTIDAPKKYEIASFLNGENQNKLVKFCRQTMGKPGFEQNVIQKMKDLLQEEVTVTASAIALFDEIGKQHPDNINDKLKCLIRILKGEDDIFKEFFNGRQHDAPEFYNAFLTTMIPTFAIASKTSITIQRTTPCSVPEDSSEVTNSNFILSSLRAALEGIIEPAKPQVKELPVLLRRRGTSDQVVIPLVAEAKKTIDFQKNLTLYIGKDSSLQDLFTGEQSEEVLFRDNLLYGCNRHLDEETINEFMRTLPNLTERNADSVKVRAARSQVLRGTNPPHLLPLAISRVKVNEKGVISKNLEKVKVPFSMQVTHVGEAGISHNQTYRLCSAVVHSGESYGGGHYYTYVPVYDSADAVTTVVRHSDRDITEVTSQLMQEDVEKNGNLFFYELVEEGSNQEELLT